MCRYRLRWHRKVIIWRHDRHRSPFVRRESGYDVQHNANAQKTKNYTDLWARLQI